MRNQDQPEGSGEQPLPAERLSPEARREVRRAALLRPVNLLVAAIGGVFFALSLGWWSIPLTLVTCAVLLFLTMRDSRFVESVLEGRENRSGLQRQATGAVDVSPDRRARWLPRGETRQKVEAALEVQRRIMLAIRESDDVVRAVLDDAPPKLDRVAERLVDVAHAREKVAGAIQDLKSRPGAPHREGEDADLVGLENELRIADAEISGTFERLLILRARVVSASVESGGASQEAGARLNADLDELNLRLDALHSTMSPPAPAD